MNTPYDSRLRSLVDNIHEAFGVGESSTEQLMAMVRAAFPEVVADPPTLSTAARILEEMGQDFAIRLNVFVDDSDEHEELLMLRDGLGIGSDSSSVPAFENVAQLRARLIALTAPEKGGEGR